MYKPLSWKMALRLFVVVCLTTTRTISAFSLCGLNPPLPAVREDCGSTTDRREVLKQGVTATVVLPWSLLLGGCPMESSAMTTTTTTDRNNPAVTSPATPPVEVVVVRGRVTLPADAGPWNDMTMMTTTPTTTTTTATTTTAAALYITCRPNRPDNVPAAILNGSRGKPPPVLSARIPLSLSSSSSSSTTKNGSGFPLDFVLTIPRDLTLEGAWDGGNMAALADSTTTMEDGRSPSSVVPPPPPLPTTLDELWWNKDELIVSVRLDTDGVAATRSPDDLVGRAIWTLDSTRVVEIQLTGRGAFGKFATGRK